MDAVKAARELVIREESKPLFGRHVPSDQDRMIVALQALAEAGIPADVQELLMYGEPGSRREAEGAGAGNRCCAQPATYEERAMAKCWECGEERGASLSSCKVCGAPLEPSAEDAKEVFGRVFDLLILARNTKDDEALQEAIDMVAAASCRSSDF